MLRNLGSLYVFLAVAAVSTMLIAVVLGERDRAEAAIRESEARYRMLVERMNEGLVLQDRDGAMTYVSDRFCEIVARPREWLIGKKGLDLAVPDEKEHWHAQHRKRQQGSTESFEIALERGSGERIDAFVSPRPLFDAAGAYAGSFALLMDVTERRRAAGAARQRGEAPPHRREHDRARPEARRRAAVVFASPSFLAYFGTTEAEVSAARWAWRSTRRTGRRPPPRGPRWRCRPTR
jgi:PAS domain S-box-containing protein